MCMGWLEYTKKFYPRKCCKSHRLKLHHDTRSTACKLRVRLQHKSRAGPQTRIKQRVRKTYLAGSRQSIRTSLPWHPPYSSTLSGPRACSQYPICSMFRSQSTGMFPSKCHSCIQPSVLVVPLRNTGHSCRNRLETRFHRHPRR